MPWHDCLINRTDIKGLIIMRTHIISADGTRFTVLPKAKRTRNKIIALAGAIIATPFMIAALIGIGLAATGNASPTLREGDKIIVPTNCWVETTDEDDTLIINCD